MPSWATVKATLEWAWDEVVKRIFRKRDEATYDRGFLAGLGTAEEAIRLGEPPYSMVAIEAIQKAREGYRHEIESRQR